MAVNPCAFFELLALPLERGRETQIIESSWPQVGGDSSQRCDHFVHQLHGRFDFCAQLRLPLCDLAPDQGQIHLDRRAGLAKLIVDFSRDGSAFFFADALKAGSEGAKLFERRLELFLSMPPFRNLYS